MIYKELFWIKCSQAAAPLQDQPAVESRSAPVLTPSFSLSMGNNSDLHATFFDVIKTKTTVLVSDFLIPTSLNTVPPLRSLYLKCRARRRAAPSPDGEAPLTAAGRAHLPAAAPGPGHRLTVHRPPASSCGSDSIALSHFPSLLGFLTANGLSSFANSC